MLFKMVKKLKKSFGDYLGFLAKLGFCPVLYSSADRKVHLQRCLDTNRQCSVLVLPSFLRYFGKVGAKNGERPFACRPSYMTFPCCHTCSLDIKAERVGSQIHIRK